MENREIKFKYFCEDIAGRMFIIEKSLTDFLNEGMNAHTRIQKIVAICQFTGLKDKNGKDVYEGDIFMDCMGFVNVISWSSENLTWIVTGVNKKDLGLLKGFSQKCIDVIGNIHTTPHLLTPNQI